eukprot:scaffold212056_cov20-Tisochrysis_lutea.AAC.1
MLEGAHVQSCSAGVSATLKCGVSGVRCYRAALRAQCTVWSAVLSAAAWGHSSNACQSCSCMSWCLIVEPGLGNA